MQLWFALALLHATAAFDALWLDRSQPELVHVEPQVTVQPGNEQHRLATAIVVAPDQSESWRCDAFASRDGGRSWQRHAFPIDRCIDPWPLLRADGTALAVAIEIGRDHDDDRRFRLLSFHSPDGGLNWSERHELGRAWEHPQLFLGPEGDSWLLGRWTRSPAESPRHQLRLARLTADGRSLELMAEHRPDDTPGPLNPTGLGLWPDGAVSISFVESEPYRVRSVYSPDGGRRFQAAVTISERCGTGGPSFPGYPLTVADRPRDRLFHLCGGPDYEGIWLSVSDDRGRSWRPARRIDPPPAEGRAHTRVPMAAVSEHGVLALAWFDRRHDPERQCQDLYLRFSLDGGATLTPARRISTETGCPSAPGNGRAGSQTWNNGGDYSGIAASPDGAFVLVWADARDGVFQLRTRSVLAPRP